MSGSTLPPESVMAIGGVKFSGCAITAATAAAPPGSTSIFERSRSSRTAREISSSVTVTMGIWCSAMMAKGTSPGVPTAMPSAMELRSNRVTGLPAASDCGKAAARSAWAPMSWVFGAPCARVTARPASKPPPPVHATTVATFGIASMISRPRVPCPATTSTLS